MSLHLQALSWVVSPGSVLVAIASGSSAHRRNASRVLNPTLHRLDNFWYCLLHELAHIGRHFDKEDVQPFVDDFSAASPDGRPPEQERQTSRQVRP